MDSLPYFIGAGLTSTLLALGIEMIGAEDKTHPDHTLLLIYIGVAFTGGWVAARIAFAPLPDLNGAALAWWTWQLTFWMFWAMALPITAWQTWRKHVRQANLRAFLLRERHANEADDGATLAAGPRNNSDQDD